MSKEEDQKKYEVSETEEEVSEDEEVVEASDDVSADKEDSAENAEQEEAQDEQASGVADKLSPKNIAIAAIVAVLVAGAFWAATGGGDWFSSREVVANVNGENITQEMLDNRINQSRALYESQGADLDDTETYGRVEEQVLQSMVQESLIMQDAEAQGITATQEEIDAEFEQIKAQFGGDDEFTETLNEYNMSVDDLMENIRVQVIIQNYLDENVSDEALEVSEEEVNEFYDAYSEGDDSAGPLSEIRTQIESELLQQKRQAEIEQIVQELESEGEVELSL